jgi:putative DNA primase/helicase
MNFEALLKRASWAQDEFRVDKVCVSDVEASDVEWLWPGRVAIGKVTLIAGDPGLGKSLLTRDRAARVSRGWAWPGEEPRQGDGEKGRQGGGTRQADTGKGRQGEETRPDDGESSGPREAEKWVELERRLPGKRNRKRRRAAERQEAILRQAQDRLGGGTRQGDGETRGQGDETRQGDGNRQGDTEEGRLGGGARQGDTQDSAMAAMHRYAVRATGSVLLLSAEDDLADTIRPRLEAAGANCERIVAVRAMVEGSGEGSGEVGRARSLDLSRDLQRLGRELMAMPDCRLVVIDPLSAYLGSNIESVNSAVRQLLTPLAKLAAERRIAVVVVTHLRKRSGAAIERAIGSVAFVATARAAWLVARDPENKERRLLVPMKNNLSEDRGGLAYTIVPRVEHRAPMVVWHPEPVQLDADELAAVHTKVQRQKKDRTEAMEWLQGYLLDGPQPASHVRQDAERQGIGYGTLRRAFQDLKGKASAMSRTPPRMWMWELPEGGKGG